MENDITQKEKDFIHAYDVYADDLFRFCILRVSDTEVASDLVQETFTKTWLYLRGGQEIEHMRAFLYQTLRNLIIDFYRKKKPVSLDEKLEEGGQIEGALHEDIEMSIEKEYDIEHVKKLLRRLPDIYQEVIILRYVEGLSIDEIGTMLGETNNAVSVRIHRALKKLETILKREEGYD